MNKWKVIPVILFLLILAGGVFLRLEGLNRQSYWMDEGYTINAVISGMQNGTKEFASILDSGSTYFCPMYCLPTEWVLRMGYWGWDHPIAFRIISTLFGILFIPISYWIAQIFFKNKHAALLTMFFTSFSTIQIAWSRQARWYTELEVFFWLALICFYVFLRASPSPFNHPAPAPPIAGRGAFLRGMLWLLVSVLFTIAAILTHPLAYALPVIMLIWFVIEKRPPFKHLFIALIAAFSVIALIEYGFGLHTLSSNLAAHFSLHNNFFYYGSYYLRNYWILLFIGALAFKRSEKEERRALFCLCIPFLIYFLGLSFFTEAIEYRYLFHTTVIFYLLAARGIQKSIEWMIQFSFRFNPNLFKVPKEKEKLIHDITFRKGTPPSPIAIVVLLLILLYTQHFILTPQPFYWLEADDPATVHNRTYYAYTPQPDFNQAYAAIQREIQPGDLVISSHPHFNKIFLNQSGYWLAYDYLRLGREIPKTQTHEFYVNATIIHDLAELQQLIKDKHGFIVFDLQSTDHRIPKETIDYIKNNLQLVFNYQTNNYSEIWVYRF